LYVWYPLASFYELFVYNGPTKEVHEYFDTHGDMEMSDDIQNKNLLIYGKHFLKFKII
jgi:hypothetical protein